MADPPNPDRGRRANEVSLTVNSTVKSHSATRISSLATSGNKRATSTPIRSTGFEDGVASGSRILNAGGSYFKDRVPESWGYNGRSSDKRASHDDKHDSEHSGEQLDKMSTWAGQPRVEGRSETMRMMLLTCVSIGITSVHVYFAGKKGPIADCEPAASPGASR
jgi:hypothetical protein